MKKIAMRESFRMQMVGVCVEHCFVQYQLQSSEKIGNSAAFEITFYSAWYNSTLFHSLFIVQLASVTQAFTHSSAADTLVQR